MTKPRIVIMANNIDEVGGAQRVVHVVAQGLAERGHQVDLVGVTPFTPRHEYLADPAFRRFTLMPQQWPAPPGSGLATRLRPSARRVIALRARLRTQAVAALARVLADGPPGIVVTSQLWAMEHLAEIDHRDWAVIGQYHSSFEAAAAGRDLPRALSLYADVDVVTLLTPEDARSFRRAGLNGTAWLPNPLAFWPTEPASTSVGDTGRLTYLGRLSPEKGVSFLLDAWGRVAGQHPGWTLRIVGSGPDERALRRQAASLADGADRVEFVAPVTDAEAELRAANLLALPSMTEGLPLVLAEAMAVGLPCVASDCSAGVRLLAADGRDGRIVPRGDAQALAEALSALMADPGERAALGERARAGVERFKAEHVLDDWERLIASVLR